MKNTLIFLSLIALSCLTQAEVPCTDGHEQIESNSKIPPYLVGIWAPEEAKFRGQYIAEGFAIYLEKDGRGAAIDPYVGANISAEYNAKNRQFRYETIEKGDVKPFKTYGAYDPLNCTFTLNSGEVSIVLNRRFASIQEQLRSGLGIK